MLHFFWWRGDLSIICGVLLRFVFRRVGDKFPLHQIFGGAQTPPPFLLKIIVSKWGQWPPFPPENMVSCRYVSSQAQPQS